MTTATEPRPHVNSAERTDVKGNWRSGWCGVDRPLSDHAAHRRCEGFGGENSKGIALVCRCRCHEIVAALTETPPGEVEAPRPASTVEVTGPGVWCDMSDRWYHADPVPERLGRSLSSTGAKTLATKTPAHFAWDRQYGRAERTAFDLGHACHTLVLGTGADLVIVKAKDWATNAAKAQKAEAYAADKTPLLHEQYLATLRMAAAVMRHPIARLLVEVDSSIREQSLFWPDPETGVWRRARPDTRVTLRSGRVLLGDLKTSTTADPARLSSKADDFGWHQQAPWYRDGAQALGLAGEDSASVFVVVEKDPPHLVSVVELDEEAERVGRELNLRALETYADCASQGKWPGYAVQIAPLSLPRWTVIRHTEESYA